MQIPWNLTSTTSALIFPTIIIFFFSIIIQKWKKSKNKSVMKLLQPPGPKALPIIGSLHLMTSPPFRCFRDLSNHYGPLMHLKLGQTPTVVISSPEIAKQMLKDHDPIFTNRPPGVAVEIMWYNYLDIAFAPYGDYWKQMRKICINELLSPRMVRSFGTIRRDEAARLVGSIHEASGKTVNLTERVFLFSSSVTCRAAIGKVCSESETSTLIKVMKETLHMVCGFEIADLFPSSMIVRVVSWPAKMRLKMMRRKLDVILDHVIDEHRQLNRRSFHSEDLVDVFLRITEEERLQFPIANDNIKAVLYDIFTAGTDTSSTIIDWIMVELIRNPQVMVKAQAEVRQVVFKEKSFVRATATATLEEDDIQKLKYLKLVIKEGLRLHPPTPLIPRASREEREINGFVVPAKVNVMVNIWAIHRDPKFWNDPERFEPERFENAQAVDFVGGDFHFLPFGTGQRMCPGITFGLVTVELALAHLLYNFNWKLPQGVKPEDLDMLENNGLTGARKDDLFLIATPYQPLV
ncbi:hypothetical protein C2S52_002768 [Perilla frutescens var. hirtella]|nr:hypothetical protein C2S52_002768 [Perilla frutescens var. hirtella]